MSWLTFEVVSKNYQLGDYVATEPPTQEVPSQTGSYYIDGSTPDVHEYVVLHNTGSSNLDITIRSDDGNLIYAPVYDITDTTFTVYLNPVIACTVYWEIV